MTHITFTIKTPVASHRTSNTHLMDITKNFLLRTMKTTSIISLILLVSPNFLFNIAFTFGLSQEGFLIVLPVLIIRYIVRTIFCCWLVSLIARGINWSNDGWSCYRGSFCLVLLCNKIGNHRVALAIWHGVSFPIVVENAYPHINCLKLIDSSIRFHVIFFCMNRWWHKINANNTSKIPNGNSIFHVQHLFVAMLLDAYECLLMLLASISSLYT